MSSGTWSTAIISVARSRLAAASLATHGVAIFAGGFSESCYVYLNCCSIAREGQVRLGGVCCDHFTHV